MRRQGRLARAWRRNALRAAVAAIAVTLFAPPVAAAHAPVLALEALRPGGGTEYLPPGQGLILWKQIQEPHFEGASESFTCVGGGSAIGVKLLTNSAPKDQLELTSPNSPFNGSTAGGGCRGAGEAVTMTGFPFELTLTTKGLVKFKGKPVLTFGDGCVYSVKITPSIGGLESIFVTLTGKLKRISPSPATCERALQLTGWGGALEYQNVGFDRVSGFIR